MISGVFKRKKDNTVVLYFDGLIPEEAHKLLDAIFDEKMDKILCENFCNVNLGYCVGGYRYEGSRIRYSNELVLTIETLEVEGSEEEKAQEMEYNKNFLAKLREVILERTGLIDEEES